MINETKIKKCLRFHFYFAVTINQSTFCGNLIISLKKNSLFNYTENLLNVISCFGDRFSMI